MTMLMELALAQMDSDETTVTTPEGYQYTGENPYSTDNITAIVSKGDGV